MIERIGRQLREVRDVAQKNSERAFAAHVLRETQEELNSSRPEEIGIGPLCTMGLKMLGVRTVRTSANATPHTQGEEHVLNDQLLNNGGVVVSNHPHFPDSLCILSTLGVRRDIMTWTASAQTQERNNTFYNGGCSPEVPRVESIVVPSASGISELRSQFTTITSHICDKSGIFYYYPTGAFDITPELFLTNNYRSGFLSLIKRLPEDTMVYYFWVNTDDISQVRKKARMRGLRALTPLHRISEMTPVRLYEAYALVGEVLEGYEKCKEKYGADSFQGTHFFATYHMERCHQIIPSEFSNRK